MERLHVESSEMELRQNRDFIASLTMIGEGGPVYDHLEDDDHEDEFEMKHKPTNDGYDEDELPSAYQ